MWYVICVSKPDDIGTPAHSPKDSKNNVHVLHFLQKGHMLLKRKPLTNSVTMNRSNDSLRRKMMTIVLAANDAGMIMFQSFNLSWNVNTHTQTLTRCGWIFSLRMTVFKKSQCRLLTVVNNLDWEQHAGGDCLKTSHHLYQPTVAPKIQKGKLVTHQILATVNQAVSG